RKEEADNRKSQQFKPSDAGRRSGNIGDQGSNSTCRGQICGERIEPRCRVFGLLNLGQRHLPLLSSDAANCCSTFERAQADDPANAVDRSTAGKLPKQVARMSAAICGETSDAGYRYTQPGCGS